MAIYIGSQKPKFYLGDQKVKGIFLGGVKVYSAGNIVTYNVDNVLYSREYEEGQDVLHPTGINPTKTNYTFKGWSKTAGGTVLSSLVMGSDAITLYAIFAYNSFYSVRNGVLQSGTTGSIVNYGNYGGYNLPGGGINDTYGYYGGLSGSPKSNGIGCNISFSTKGAPYMDITIRGYRGAGLEGGNIKTSGTGLSTQNWDLTGGDTKTYSNINVSGYNTISISCVGNQSGGFLGAGIKQVYLHQ